MLDAPEKVLNWLFRIANQLVIGWYRKGTGRDPMQLAIDIYEAEGEIASTTVVHQIAHGYEIDTQKWTALSEAIAQLPELEQQMFRLQLEQKSYEEIAEICGAL